jgi:hypothetical protein
MAHGDESSEKRSRWLRRVAYWGGRLFQVLGLLLLWCTLMIFPTAGDIRALLYGGVAVAAAVFYLGWLVVRWAVKAT